MKTISLRSQLLGEMVAFLEEEEMECTITQKGVVDLISQLAHYKEEGKELFPEIFIIDDLETVRKVLTPCTWHKIGSGEKTEKTMLDALKKCAPLTEGNWAILIHRKENTIDYGVCQAGSHLLSVNTSEILIDPEQKEPKAIHISQVAERLIEIRGSIANPLLISFSSQTKTVSPLSLQMQFVNMIVCNMSRKYQEQGIKFFSSIFLEVLQKGHGTLACIIDSKKKEIPKKLTDGRVLPERININKIIEDLLENESLSTNRELEGYRSLIVGMLNSDGITVFSNSGEILAYNVFIKHSKRIKNNETSGGARSRTYLTLCQFIGNGLEGAYIQSQDGDINVKGNE